MITTAAFLVVIMIVIVIMFVTWILRPSAALGVCHTGSAIVVVVAAIGVGGVGGIGGIGGRGFADFARGVVYAADLCRISISPGFTQLPIRKLLPLLCPPVIPFHSLPFPILLLHISSSSFSNHPIARRLRPRKRAMGKVNGKREEDPKYLYSSYGPTPHYQPRPPPSVSSASHCWRYLRRGGGASVKDRVAVGIGAGFESRGWGLRNGGGWMGGCALSGTAAAAWLCV